jgi:hypothetical protein
MYSFIFRNWNTKFFTYFKEVFIGISKSFVIASPAKIKFNLLGIRFEGKFDIDKCLPMGCAIYFSLFQKFSTFLQWLVQIKSVIYTLVHYLNYFIFAGEAITNDFEIPMNTSLK